jgi:hypothetical protein
MFRMTSCELFCLLKYRKESSFLFEMRAKVGFRLLNLCSVCNELSSVTDGLELELIGC